MRFALVGCGKEKLDHAAPARDLYTGPLFRAARMWAETFAERWFILSAKHGLVEPDAVIEPYDVKLSDLSRDERVRWGEWTAAQVANEISDDPDDTVVALAGSEYTDTLGRHGSGLWRSRLITPLDGLGVGERLAWFKRSMVAGVAIRRMRAAEADGAWGRVELTAAECTALFGMGLAGSFHPLGIYREDSPRVQPERSGSRAQLALIDVHTGRAA